MTDFNQVNSILKLRSCSRQPVEYHVPLVLNSCKNNLPKSVNILLGQPAQIDLLGILPEPDPEEVDMLQSSLSVDECGMRGFSGS